MKEKSIYEIILCNNIIYKLFKQQIHYTVNIAYKILKLKKTLDEIETLMRDRWSILFGKDYDTEKFSKDEIIVYNTTLSATVNIDTYGLTINDITNNDKVTLSLNDVEFMDEFLKE